jgi:hypothetical protein
MNHPPRRTLRFESLDAMLNDARAVVQRPHVTVGNWTTGQILDHVARVMDCAFDGFDFRLPFWIPWLVKPFRNRFLVQPLRSGVRLPRRAANLLPSEPVTTEEALARLERSVERLKSQNPTQLHPVLGRLTSDEHRRLNLRHAELHLSFIVPAE